MAAKITTSGLEQSAAACGGAALLYEFSLMTLRGLADFGVRLYTPGAGLDNPMGISAAATQLLLLAITVLALIPPLLFLLVVCPQRAAHGHCALGFRQQLFLCFPLFFAVSFAAGFAGGALRKAVGTAYGAALPERGVPLAIAFLALCAVPAFGEELLFRGAMQGCLRPFGSAVAVVGQALLFALLHGEISQCFAALVCGLAFGLVAEYTGGVRVGIVLHFCNNVLAFCSLYGEQYLDPASMQAPALLGVLLVCAWALGTVLFAAKKNIRRQLCTLQNGESPLILGHCRGYLLVVIGLTAMMLWRNFVS